MDWKECREVADELSDQNREALDHYQTCRAVGRFPPDPLSDWAALLIRREEDDATAEAEKDAREGIKQMLALLYRTRR